MYTEEPISLNSIVPERPESTKTENTSQARHINLKFAPLSRPLHRRKETCAVLWHTITIPVFIVLFFFSLAVPLFWVFVVPYLIYFFFDKTPENGKVIERYSKWFRRLGVWEHFCNYFPMKIHKTTNLEPTFTERVVDHAYHNIPVLNYFYKFKKKPFIEKVKTGPNYIFGLHPHGVVSLSGFGAFATDGAGFGKIFPGIPVFLMTLVQQFSIPLFREYLLALGITSSSKLNGLEILRQGFSLTIVVGGAQEALLSSPRSNDLVLERRKGFIKLALETGNVGLVPTYCFGETDLYQVIELESESTGRKLQLWLKRNFGFTIPFFHARGIFNYDFGLLPYRKEVTIVTGNPIIVPYLPDPSEEEVEKYHKLYVEELKRIFNDYKAKYLDHGDKAELNIVE